MIINEEEYNKALAEAEELVDRLNDLGDEIEEYEDKYYPIGAE